MKLFQKREKFTQNIAYMAMMAAINVIISLVASFFPMTSLFIMIIAPASSAIIGYYCKEKYLWIYFFSAIVLCLLTTCYDISNTLFYTVPSIISGTLFGLLKSKRRSNAETVFLVSILSSLLGYASLWLVQLIYEIDMIETTLVLFKLVGNDYIYDIVPSFIFVYALFQTCLSSLFIQLTSLRLESELLSKKRRGFIYSIYAISFLLLTLVFSFFSTKSAYLTLMIALYWSVFSSILGWENRWNIYLGYSLSFVVGFILFLVFYSYLSGNKGLLLLAIPLFGLSLTVLLNNLLFKEK